MLTKRPNKSRPNFGVDEMMSDIIQYRAMVYAFEHTENCSFTKTILFTSWHCGMTYAIFCLFDKLIYKKDDCESSLRKSWNHSYKQESFPHTEETKSIDTWFKTIDKHRSQSLAYRHLVVAHNSRIGENEPIHDWNNFSWVTFDDELKYLIDAYKILSRYSETMLLFPFIEGHEIFAESNTVIHDRENQNKLITRYNDYLNKTGLKCTFSIKIQTHSR